ncbi:MAG: RES family NAD+ phosphorylase, partial [Casimicrobiaceae bacterium]
IDLRGKQKRFPALVSRTSYAFTQSVGNYVHEQGLNGLLVDSARCAGVNSAVFKPERLSNVREKMFLTYRCNPTEDQCVVERTPGRVWMKVKPSALA